MHTFRNWCTINIWRCSTRY